MSDLAWEDVKKFLADNKDSEDFKALIGEVVQPAAPEQKPLTPDLVNEYLQTAEGKALIQPMMDKRVTDAIKTYRENNFEKELKEQVAKEILKMNPQETPEQKQIRELREAVEKERSAREHDTLVRQIVEECAKRQLPTFWVEDFKGDTLDEAKVFMGKVENSYKDLENKVKNEPLSSGYRPGSGRETNDKKTKLDISKLSQADLIDLEMNGKLDEAIASK